MKFIKDIFVLLKDTTWPNRKERWKNFISVIEYTDLFVRQSHCTWPIAHDQFLLRKEAMRLGKNCPAFDV